MNEMSVSKFLSMITFEKIESDDSEKNTSGYNIEPVIPEQPVVESFSTVNGDVVRQVVL